MRIHSLGQIQIGDKIRCELDGVPRTYVVQEIINKGTKTEKVIVNKQGNQYFITSMVLNGTSWAKKAKIINRYL